MSKDAIIKILITIIALMDHKGEEMSGVWYGILW